MRPLRVAVFTNQFPGYVSTFFARDMRALIDAGIDVDVFALYPHDATLWAYVPDVLSERELPRERVHHLTAREALAVLRPHGLRPMARFLRETLAIAASSVRFGPVVLAKSLYAALLAWAWASRIGNRYDHVLAYWGNYPGTCAYLFHRLVGDTTPFSLCVHAQIDLYENPAYLEAKLEYADNVITICEFNRAFIRRHYPETYGRILDRIHVNYRGLDLADFPCSFDDRASNRVLAVGRLSPEKGYDTLLHAIAELVRRGVDVTLDLVGDGPERQALLDLTSTLGIRDHVTFQGWLHPDDVRRAMSEATVLAQPSRIEGLPTVVEEAMAAGIPVVASRVGGIPELLDEGRCGMIVSPDDVAELADALQVMLLQPAHRRTLAARARRRAEDMLDMWRNGRELADLLRASHRSRLALVVSPTQRVANAWAGVRRVQRPRVSREASSGIGTEI